MTSPVVPLGRVLLAFALLGAGVVNLGQVRGVLPAAQGWLALAVGTGELVAAVVVLRGGPGRRGARDALATAAIGLLAGVSVLGVLLAYAPGGHLGAAAAAAAALQLVAAGGVGATVRRAHPAGSARVPAVRRPGPALALLFVGAIAVSTVTTAGLTDTAAGEHAVPHGEHHLPDLPGLEQHHHGG